MFSKQGRALRYFIFGFLVLGFLFSSCVSHRKLKMLIEDAGDSGTYALDSAESYKVQPGDLLEISIKGPSPSQVEIFSKELNESVSGQSSSTSAMFLRGYLIDKHSHVELPLVGKVFVKGYTLDQVSDTLASHIKNYLKFTTVTVKLLNFRVTVLGEVKSPGVQLVYFADASIFQALGMAGDMTDLANRKRVKLVRQNNEKKTIEVHVLNLNDNSLLGSEFYYMQPNDLIYVEPLKQKVVRVNSPTVTLIISVTTLLLLVYNISTR